VPGNNAAAKVDRYVASILELRDSGELTQRAALLFPCFPVSHFSVSHNALQLHSVLGQQSNMVHVQSISRQVATMCDVIGLSSFYSVT